MPDPSIGTLSRLRAGAASRSARRLLAGASILAPVLSFAPARAQQSDTLQVSTLPAGALTRQAPYRVVFDPLAGSIELQNQRGKLLERWGQFSAAAALADIPADRPVSVVITNANPLLYDYEVQAQVLRVEETGSCTDMGRLFAREGFLLSSAAVSGVVMPSFEAPAITSGFLDVNGAFSESLGTRGSARLTEAALETELGRIRADVNSFVDFTARLAALARSVDDSIALFAAKAERLPLDTVIGRFQQTLEAIEPGLGDPAQTPVIIEGRARAAAAAVSTLRDLARAIETGSYVGSGTDIAAQETLLLDRRVDNGVSQLEASYPVLQSNLLRIARVKSQSTRIFTVGESRGAVRRLVITSRSNGSHDDVLRLREGDVEVFTRPRQRLMCSVSLGLNWLEPLPAYAFDSDGRLLDANTDDRRVAPSLMVQLAASSVPLLGLNLGVGIGRNSAPDLYLGGTLRLFEPVMLNMGWVWQRTPQLPAGMRIGERVTEPDPLLLNDLDLKYEPTIYFGLGIVR